MIITEIPLSKAQLYKSLLLEFKPDWYVEIIEEDYNLYKLGFIKEIPCSLQLDVTIEQIDELYEEITEMEADIYLYEDILLKPSYALSKEERDLRKEIELQGKEYTKFAPLEGLCWHVFNLGKKIKLYKKLNLDCAHVSADHRRI